MNNIADDRYEIYFTEKMWEMIPAIYRHEDGLAENPDVLRGLIEVMAEQAAILRRSQDSLWDDQFIEICNDWAIPYIGDLLGTRMISASNERGFRTDVAKTIYYRRRKGTLRILEELISDITDWDGTVVENFTRLARNRHGLDPHPEPLAGRLSNTQPGGWADIRQSSASELVDGPFDEYFHTAQMPQHRGHKGRYGIPKLAFHLYRLKAYMVSNSTPFDRGDGLGFTFDPSGRDIPLFVRRDRSGNWDEWRSALEWQLPSPIRCRLLGHEEYLINEDLIQELVSTHGLSIAGATELRLLSGRLFRNRERLRISLEASGQEVELLGDPIFLPLLHGALIDDCGKKALIAEAEGDEASIYVDAGAPEGFILSERIQSGQLSNWAANAQTQTRLVIDPERGRFLFLGAQPGDDLVVMYHYGFSGNLDSGIGAGTYDRRKVEDCEPTVPLIDNGENIAAGSIDHGHIDPDGIVISGVTQIENSLTYEGVGNKNAVVDLTLQAANQERPYIRLTRNWILTSYVPVAPEPEAQLSLEGLWIGGENTISNPGQKEIVLRGDYECVVISHCTLDPGGFINTSGTIESDASGQPILPVPLIIEATIENLFIVSSITGPIFTRGAGMVERITIEDSIIHSVDELVPALQFNAGETILNRVTVFGAIDVHRLQASESILSRESTVLDTQSGCFRFSAAPKSSRLPKPYESFLFDRDTNHWFTSRKFGQPGYSQLSDSAPQALKRGGENGSEIGAFNALVNPIKLDGLKAKVEEYMPFGLIPIFINET